MKFINQIFSITIIYFFLVLPIFGQENPKPKKFFTLANEESMEKYVDEFDHRLKFRLGFGFGTLNPGILNETGSSWMINSILQGGSSPGVPIAFPVSKSQNLSTLPQYQEMSYGWKNRLDLSWSLDKTLGSFDQNSSASIMFITPRTDNYWAAGFEGNRLLRFEGVSEHIRLSYTFPVLDWLMVGPSINYHRYTEKNEVTSGSYTARRSDNQTTWSAGGSASAEYSMRGYLPGILIKAQLLPWWEVRSRFELVNRSGDFSMLGAQLIQITGQDSSVHFGGAVPAYYGTVKDTGNLFMLESSFRYCRFTLDIGILRQEVQRKYSLYMGDTFGGGARSDFSVRTSGLGLGEMSGKFKHSTMELYFIPSVSFHFDDEGVY